MHLLCFIYNFPWNKARTRRKNLGVNTKKNKFRQIQHFNAEKDGIVVHGLKRESITKILFG